MTSQVTKMEWKKEFDDRFDDLTTEEQNPDWVAKREPKWIQVDKKTEVKAFIENLLTLSERRVREEGVALGYSLASGYSFIDFEKFHPFVEEVAGRPVWTHEMASKEFWNSLKEKYERDALKKHFPNLTEKEILASLTKKEGE